MTSGTLQIIPNETAMEKLFLSVIMPALNEEKNILPAIQATFQAFRDLNIQGEIIVVNDGSSDNTEVLVREMAAQDSRIRMLKHEKSEGIGASFWDGMQDAQGNIVTMFPGDNENNPYEALRYLDLLQHVDIVVPFVYHRRFRGKLRAFLSFLYRSIINLSFQMNLNYTNGTVLYRKSILGGMHLQSKGFLYQAEILVKMIRKGYLFAEVPYSIRKRDTGTSKAISFHSLFNVVKSYFFLLHAIYGSGSNKHQNGTVRDSATFIRQKEMMNGENHS
jgi:dolichol-phosphate mannosyltransferase